MNIIAGFAFTWLLIQVVSRCPWIVQLYVMRILALVGFAATGIAAVGIFLGSWK